MSRLKCWHNRVIFLVKMAEAITGQRFVQLLTQIFLEKSNKCNLRNIVKVVGYAKVVIFCEQFPRTSYTKGTRDKILQGAHKHANTDISPGFRVRNARNAESGAASGNLGRARRQTLPPKWSRARAIGSGRTPVPAAARRVDPTLQNNRRLISFKRR